jgi:methyltransferase FkbM-like protein
VKRTVVVLKDEEPASISCASASVGRTISMPEDLRLVIHHIGGRGGTRRFPVMSAFEGELTNILYEADASAIDEIGAATSQYSSRQRVLPFCVTGVSGLTSFNKLYNAAASSVLAVDSSLARAAPWLAEGGGIDYDDEAWRVLQASNIRGRSLDEILNVRAPPVPLPDFLSINTQGNEGQILSGGQAVLSDTCIGLQCEVSFRQVYVEQASFDQISAEAKRQGFEFARFAHHGVRGHGFRVRDDVIRTPIGLRGGGVQLQSDAIYFKSPELILAHHRNPMLDLLKGVFIGFVLEYFDYSFACATTYAKRAAVWDKELLDAGQSQYRYLEFVAEYLAELERYPSIYPPAWTHVFPPGSDQPRDHAELRQRYFAATDKAGFKQKLSILLDPEFVLIEKLALRFDMGPQAELLRYGRLSSIWDILRRLGLVIERSDHGADLDVDALEAI